MSGTPQVLAQGKRLKTVKVTKAQKPHTVTLQVGDHGLEVDAGALIELRFMLAAISAELEAQQEAAFKAKNLVLPF